MSAVQHIQPAPFAYDDDKQSIVVEQRFSEAQTLMRQGLTSMIEAGGKFAEIRELLLHNRQGGFDGWIETKQLGRRTVYKTIELHATFGTVQHIARLDIATTAAYLLAAPSAPDEARQEALDRAAAGERITVRTAQTLITDRKPSPPPAPPAATTDSQTPAPQAPEFAPVAAILDGLVQWLATVAPGDRDTQRIILYNIEASTLVGQQHLERLLGYSGLPKPSRRADVLTAVTRLFAAMKATHEAARGTGTGTDASPITPGVKTADLPAVTPPPHDYSYTGTELGEGVRAWLKDIFAEDEERWPALLQAIVTDRNNGGHQLWENLRHSRRLYAFTPAELLAAVRTLHAELTAARPPEPAPEIEADEVEAQYAPIFALEGGIRAWLAAFPVPDRLPLMEAIKAERTHHPHFLALAGATPAPRRIGDVYQAINNTVDQLRVAAEQAAARAASLPEREPMSAPTTPVQSDPRPEGAPARGAEESDLSDAPAPTPRDDEPDDRMIAALARIRTHLRDLQRRIGTSVELDMALIAVDEAEELWSLLAA